MELTNLDGVGEAKAEKLKDHGYEQVEDVAFAALLHFDEVPDVSRDLIWQAQAMLADHPDVAFRIEQPLVNKDAIGHYWCGDCGQHFRNSFALQYNDNDKRRHNCDRTAKMSYTTR